MRTIRVTFAIAVLTFAALSAQAEKVTDLAARLELRVFQSGVEAPDFELVDLNGDRRTLGSYRGRVVFLNFWATWCPPCREEMPSMQALYEQYSDSGLAVVAVDLQESEAAVSAFAREFEITFDILLDTDGRVGAMYGIRSIPTTYIVGRDGMIVAGALGARDWASEDAFRYFEAILKE